MIDQPAYNEAHIYDQIEARANGSITNADYSEWQEILYEYEQVLILISLYIEEYGENFIDAISVNTSSWFRLMNLARPITYFGEMEIREIPEMMANARGRRGSDSTSDSDISFENNIDDVNNNITDINNNDIEDN